ncbi:hypothetical protein [Armatimonas rosea]|uniref:Uncharacterized protein n=1 Tax=Armatimonas rosea TaxID=685828 RepID=A0A7W9SS65_ARMRO|nr:hypothetical protein [Armatimonas rosea]MBB6051832.1 hypothetical protein [Armatimonas rosea]
MQRQQQKRKGSTFTPAELVIMTLNLGLALGVGFLRPPVPDFPRYWDPTVLISWGLFLALVGYIGAGTLLLLRARRIAALFQFLSAVAWWCLFANALLVGRRPDGTYHPAALAYCDIVFLIGLVHALIARWLSRREDTNAGDSP